MCTDLLKGLLTKQSDKPMVYHHQREVTLQLKQCTRQLEELNTECLELKV